MFYSKKYLLRYYPKDIFDCMLSDCHRHVKEVTYDIGNSGSYSECTVHTVTVSVGSDCHRHVTGHV